MPSNPNYGTESHPTVKVTFRDLEAEIDVEIAPLIQEIWYMGLKTYNSCQDNPEGWVWIEFGHAKHAEIFLNVIAFYESAIDSLYNRIRQQWRYSNGKWPEGCWEYTVHPLDYSIILEKSGDDQFTERQELPPKFHFRFSIRFPKKDLETILSRVKNYNLWRANMNGRES